MYQREVLKEGFLQNSNWQNATLAYLAGDASFRSYERVHKLFPIAQDTSKEELQFAVLMDAPPEKEDVKPFIYMDNKLRELGLNAPIIYAQDIKNGFLLIEDFQDISYNKLLPIDATNSSANDNLHNKAREIYQSAIDALLKLHSYGEDENLADYDISLLQKELEIFIDFYIPLMTENKNTSQIKEQFLQLWKDPLNMATNNSLPTVIVLRDYHADNLMWIEQENNLAKVGLLDFQDAVNGSPAYDLMSLLEDARRDISSNFAQRMLQYYLEKSPILNHSDFRRTYAILAAQRNLKILGIFARLYSRDNKAEYLNYIPRVWRYLQKDLETTELKKIKSFIDQHCKTEVRSIIHQIINQENKQV